VSQTVSDPISQTVCDPVSQTVCDPVSQTVCDPVSQTVCDPEVAEVVARAKAASRSLCSLIDKLSISKQLGRQPAFLLPARQSD